VLFKKRTAPSQLNICLVAKRFPLLGRNADTGFLWPVARGLVQRGHKVTVLTARTPFAAENTLEKDGVTAHLFGDRKTFSSQVFGRFERIHRENPFHLVHSLDDSGLSIGLQRRQLRVAMAYDVDATQMSHLFSILGMAQETFGSLVKTSFAVAYNFLKTFYRHDRKILKSADAVFVHSPQQRTALERYYLYPDRRIFTVPFGLGLDDLSPREKSEEVMKKIGLPPHAQVVVTETDMTEFGEMSHLLQAFERVAVKKPSARLIVVGTGPLKKQIEFEMLNLALGSRVIFVGEATPQQLADYIAVSDVFVNLSARTSGVEQSVLEAMAQKKVVIGSEVSPLATVVEDGVDGFLIRPADTLTLSELLMQIFGGQISGLEMGERARQKVLNLFDSEVILRQTLEAYNNAVVRAGL
jgi:1,2-diacylglycerol 3-alpha-glucosyltransferase